jgi:preprotein translocase subunit SecB
MSENGKNPDQSAAVDGPPGLSVNAQYVKDLSFENPNAPQVLTQAQGRPQIEVAVDVRARNLTQSSYEVAVRIAATAKQTETTVFVVELLYAGVFTLLNIPQDQVELVLLIECPRILFPFARRIVADATRDGGFPPLMLEPIDFLQLYQQQRQQGQKPVAQA